MNEQNLARRIKQHLDFGLTTLKGDTSAQLREARLKALAAYRPATQQVAGMAWAGSRNGAFQPFNRAWVPLAALVFGLLLVSYWQTYYHVDDQSEIDAFLLAEDLPVQAYLDKGFDAWLEDTAQE
ncbi:MAG: DUF3619 family protein [Sulfuricella sp.]|nr:DUF3619 family protein [Sulfuricella sp.]